MNGRRLARPAGVLIAVLATAAAVTAVLAAQSADPKSVATARNTDAVITLTGSSDAGAASFNITGGPSHGSLDLPSGGPMTCSSPPACSADVTYSPAGGYEGSDSFTYNVQDTDGTSLDATVSIAVGSAPVAADDPDVTCLSGTSGGSYTTNEDTPLVVGAASPCGLLANDSDADPGDTLTATRLVDGSHGSAAVGLGGGFTYTPTANANGDDTFTYTASDGVLSSTATVHVHIVPVNDPPTFTAGAAPTVDEDSGAFSQPGWATAISSGPGDESGQTLDFQLTTDSASSLFTTEPALSPSGTLTFTPAPDANGTATIGFKLHDNGGGTDLSVEHTFTLTINAVNDAPTFTAGSNEVVNQGSGAFSAPGWATGMSVGPANESTQTLAFAFTADDNPTLFSVAPAVAANGTLTFTPAPGHTGSAQLTLAAQDDGGTAHGGVDTSGPAAVTIRVNAAPNAINDTSFVVAQDSPGQLLAVLANDTSLPDPPEALIVTATSSGPNHGNVTIALDGSSVTYTPAAGYSGADQFDYTIADPFGATDTATVFLQVAKDTTPPIVTAPLEFIRSGVSIGTSTIPGYLTWTGSDPGVGLARFELQRSINGGAYVAIALSPVTRISYYASFTVGTRYVFRVRAVDRNGNASAWLSSQTITPARYEESSSTIHYSGTWARSYNSLNSGGYTRYTTVSGRSLTFVASFRDIAFVAPTSSGRGTVAIYLNGTKVATISLKSSASRTKYVAWTYHLSTRATRTIKVVVVGNVRVDVDCFATY